MSSTRKNFSPCFLIGAVILTTPGIARERSLSSIFVSREEFGTRCSTVILVGRDNRMTFLERSFDAHQKITGTVEFNLDLNTGA